MADEFQPPQSQREVPIVEMFTGTNVHLPSQDIGVVQGGFTPSNVIEPALHPTSVQPLPPPEKNGFTPGHIVQPAQPKPTTPQKGS